MSSPSFEPEDERWCPRCERRVRYHFGYTDVLLECWCPRCHADLTTANDVWIDDAGEVLERIVRDLPDPEPPGPPAPWEVW